jgi:hypothetical protein
MSYSDKIDASGNPVSNPYTAIFTAIDALKTVANTTYETIYVYEMIGDPEPIETPVDISVEKAEVLAALELLKEVYLDHYNNTWLANDAYKTKLMFLSSATNVQNEVNNLDGLPPVAEQSTYMFLGTKTFDADYQASEVAIYSSYEAEFAALIANQPEIGEGPDVGYLLENFTPLHEALVADIATLTATFETTGSGEVSANASAMAFISSYAYVAFGQNATGTLAEVMSIITPGVI